MPLISHLFIDPHTVDGFLLTEEFPVGGLMLDPKYSDLDLELAAVFVRRGQATEAATEFVTKICQDRFRDRDSSLLHARLIAA